MSDNDLRTMMNDATADAPAPAREFSTPVIAAEARARTRRRRTWYGVSALGAAACATAIAAVGFGALGGPSSDGAPVAVGPTTSSPATDPGTIDPGGIALPSSLPLGETVVVVDEALPEGVTVGELPMDAAWSPDGALTLPLVTADGTAELALTATAGGCTADSAALDAATLDAVSAGICTAAAQYPNQPGTVVDSGPVDPAA